MLRHRVVRVQRRLLSDAAAGERSATLVVRDFRSTDLGLAWSTRVSLWVRRRRNGRLAPILTDHEPEVSDLFPHIYRLMQHCVYVPAIRLAHYALRVQEVDVVLHHVAWLAHRRCIDGDNAEEALVSSRAIFLLVLHVRHDGIGHLITVLFFVLLSLFPEGRHRLGTLHASAWLSSNSGLLLQIGNVVQIYVEHALLTTCAHLSCINGLDNL